MDARKWTIDLAHDHDWDAPTGVTLNCTSCTGVGSTRIEGDTLAHVIDLATDHDRTIHRR